MRDRLFTDETIGADSNSTSEYSVLMDGLENHAIQYELTGDGTATFEILVTVEGGSYVSSGTPATGVTKTSGPSSNGKDIIPLKIKPADLLKLKVTETGTTDSVTINAWLVQK